MSEPTTRILDLSDYWNMVRARKWTVIVAAILIAGISASYVLLKPKQYFAQAKVEVTPLIDVFISPVPGATPNSTAPDMGTEAEVAKSVDIATQVRTALGLTATPESLVKHVSVSVVGDTTVLAIGYVASTPQQAADVANAFATQYLVRRHETVSDRVSQALAPFRTRLDAATEEYSQAQRDYYNTTSSAEKAIIKQRLETLGQTIKRLNGSIDELTSSGSVAQGGQVIQDAVIPLGPVGPQLPLAVTLGLIVGAMLGAGIAIAKGLRDNKVGGRDELAMHLGAPVMAVIPRVEGWSRSETAELVTREEPGAPASEAYRTLATNVRFFRSQQPLRILVVTSAMPAEGKSATAANLAVVLAETGLRTVLVDADLRRPRASRFIGVTDRAGLREALEGTRDLVDVIQATDTENLWIVGAGVVPQDPVSLLAGPNADAVFEGLRRVADIVVCDAPPVLPVADASVLAEESDAVLFVHDPGISNRTALEDAVRQLRTAGGAIIGGVYNNVSAAQRNYLGYASYDEYYGPGKDAPQPVGAAVDAPAGGTVSANGAGAEQTSGLSGNRP